MEKPPPQEILSWYRYVTGRDLQERITLPLEVCDPRLKAHAEALEIYLIEAEGDWSKPLPEILRYKPFQ